jgi:endonuclease/exonuclease/phosphatase family metal-dependent hydrolase
VRRRPSWSALSTLGAAAGFEDITEAVVWTHGTGRLPLRQKLDAVLLKSGSSVSRKAWTLETDASDHLPVFVELRWQ